MPAAVELARRREKPIGEIAHDLGIAESSLRRWMKQDDIDAGRTEGVTSDERAELVQLRRELRVVQMEIEILKRRAPTSPGRTFSQIGFRLVGELAADGICVAVGLPGSWYLPLRLRVDGQIAVDSSRG